MKNLLFIPFSAIEGNFSLFLRGLTWRSTLGDFKQLDKIPEIVAYRRANETDADYEDYQPLLFNLPSDKISSDTNLYIFSDGMGDEHYVTNVNYYFQKLETFVMPIELIAARLKNVGFTPEIASKLKSAKLFICGGETGESDLLAINFAKALGPAYKDLTLHYYTAPITVPFSRTGAFQKFWQEVQPISDDKEAVFINRGRAKEKRKTIKVGDVLESGSKEEVNSQIAHLVNNDIAFPLGAYESLFKIVELNQNEHDDETLPSLSPVISEPDEDVDKSNVEEPSESDTESNNDDDKIQLQIEELNPDQEDKSKAIVARKNWAIIPFNIFEEKKPWIGPPSFSETVEAEHKVMSGIKR